MLYLFAPIAYPEYQWFMGAILSVEINTWFLIARRLVYGSRNNATTTPPSTLLSVTQFIISSLFYLSWIVIRCYLYPSYLIWFFVMAEERIRETQVYFHNEMIFICVHTVLCLLNLKWSYDLFTPIVKRWLGLGPKQVTISSGL